jgi:hypothetical protein
MNLVDWRSISHKIQRIVTDRRVEDQQRKLTELLTEAVEVFRHPESNQRHRSECFALLGHQIAGMRSWATAQPRDSAVASYGNDSTAGLEGRMSRV